MLDFITAEELADRFIALQHCMTDFATTDTGKPYVIFRVGDHGVCLCEDKDVYLQKISRDGDYINVGPREKVELPDIETAYRHLMENLISEDDADSFDKDWLHTAIAQTLYMFSVYRDYDDYDKMMPIVAPFLEEGKMFDFRNIWGKLFRITVLPEKQIYLVFTFNGDKYECLFFDKDFKIYKRIPVFDEEEVLRSVRNGVA